MLVALPARIRTIDGLRGIAAVLVVLYHFQGAVTRTTAVQWAPSLLAGLMEHGGYGVDIFFVISGFVIAFSTRGGEYTLGYLGRFIARRVIRLDPPYWTAILVEIALIVVATRVLHLSGAQLPSLPQTLAHLVYAQNILGYGDISPIFWTLCYEVQFYVFFVLMLVAWHSLESRIPPRARKGMVLVVLTTIFVASVITRYAGTPVHGVAINRWYQFFIGVLVYWTLTGAVRPWALILANVAILAAAGFWQAGWWQIIPLVVSALLVVVAYRGTLETVFGGRMLQFLGRISYSLYLFHGSIGERTIAVLGRVHGGEIGAVFAWVELTIALAVSVTFAWVVWWILERPAMQLSKRIRVPRAAPVSGGASTGGVRSRSADYRSPSSDLPVTSAAGS